MSRSGGSAASASKDACTSRKLASDPDAVVDAATGRATRVSERLEATLEGHVLEGSPDLYGERLTVRFRHKLRDEQKFPSLDALKAGIAADKANARTWLANHG